MGWNFSSIHTHIVLHRYQDWIILKIIFSWIMIFYNRDIFTLISHRLAYQAIWNNLWTLVFCSCNALLLRLQKQNFESFYVPQFKYCWRTRSTYLSSNRSGILSSCLLFSFSQETPFRRLLGFSLIHSLHLTPSSLQNCTPIEMSEMRKGAWKNY